MREESEFYYRDYLQALLLGMDDSPVLDSFWSPERKVQWLATVEATYACVIGQHPKTRTARIVIEYYPLVKKSGFSRSPEVARFLKAHQREYGEVSLLPIALCHDTGSPLSPERFREFWRGTCH